jgi:hypothetical protein
VKRVPFSNSNYEPTVELSRFTDPEAAFINSFPWKGTEGFYNLNSSNFVAYLAALRLQADLGFISTKETIKRTLGDIRGNAEFLYETSAARRSLADFAETVRYSSDQPYKSAVLTVLVDVAAYAKVAEAQGGVAGSEFGDLVSSFSTVSFDEGTDIRYAIFPLKRLVDLVIDVKRWDLCLDLAQALDARLASIEDQLPKDGVLLGPKGAKELSEIVKSFTLCSQWTYVMDPSSGTSASRGKVQEGSAFIASNYPDFSQAMLNFGKRTNELGVQSAEIEKYTKEFQKHSGS